jgi:hypothetical protein
MNKKELENFQIAINETSRLIKDYERSSNPNSLLLERLEGMRQLLLEDFFQAATKNDKKVQRSKKKPEKPSQPDIPKIGT